MPRRSINHKQIPLVFREYINPLRFPPIARSFTSHQFTQQSLITLILILRTQHTIKDARYSTPTIIIN